MTQTARSCWSAPSQHPPYKRPPLTKGLWTGSDEAKIWKHTEDTGAELVLGRRIVRARSRQRAARPTTRATEYAYEKLLFATGGEPRRLGGNDDQVVYYRTFDDYRTLKPVADRGGARDHHRRGVHRLGARRLAHERRRQGDDDLPRGRHCAPRSARRARPLRYRLLPRQGRRAAERGVRRLGRRHTVHTGSGRTLEADAVVGGLGIVPSTSLAEALGLPVDNGIVVDEYGRVDGRDDVFAAGDVANYPNLVLGDSSGRTEHEDHANTHGRIVGENMAGASKPYDHLPFFYSDLFDLGYEAVGEVDARLATVETLGRAEPQGDDRLRRRRPPAARLPSLECLGQGRCSTRAHQRRRARRRGALV